MILKRGVKTTIKSVFVLGSTSAIAMATCRELAKNGCKYFHLLARNNDKNKKFANLLKEKFGVKVKQEQINLEYRDKSDLKCISVKDYDLYLITAGYMGDSKIARQDSLESIKIIESTFSGIVPWINKIVTPERLNKNSKLWILSSVAGDRGRPSNYHYGAAKAALTILSEGVLLRSFRKPFSVRIIKAGYITSPMTIGKAPKALCISSERAARILVNQPNRSGIQYLPIWWRVIMFIVRLLPPYFATKL